MFHILFKGNYFLMLQTAIPSCNRNCACSGFKKQRCSEYTGENQQKKFGKWNLTQVSSKWK